MCVRNITELYTAIYADLSFAFCLVGVSNTFVQAHLFLEDLGIFSIVFDVYVALHAVSFALCGNVFADSIQLCKQYCARYLVLPGKLQRRFGLSGKCTTCVRAARKKV